MKLVTIERVIIAVLLIGLLLFYRCKRQEHNKQQDVITALELKNQSLESTVNKQGQTITLQEAIVTQQASSLSSLTDSIFNLKKSQDRKIKEVIAYYKGTTTTRIDTVLIPFTDTVTVPTTADCPSSSFLAIPRNVAKQTPNYSFGGTIDRNGLTINQLAIPDTMQLRFVEKGGFLKRRTVEVQFFHSNPLITTTQANSAVYKPPRKKRIVEKALLIGVGVFLGTRL